MNYFEVLDVPTTADAAAVKRAYRKTSKRLHPDKLPTASAADNARFAALSDAYNVLADPELRDVYEKFGDQGVAMLARGKDANAMFTQLMTQMAVFYVSWAVMTYLMTIFRRWVAAAARCFLCRVVGAWLTPPHACPSVCRGAPMSQKWAFTALAIMVAMEIRMVFSDSRPLANLLPYTTRAELVSLLHTVFPAFVSGCTVLASLWYIDPLQVLLQQNIEIMTGLGHVHQQLKDLEVRVNEVKGGAGGAGAPARVAKPTDMNPAVAAKLKKAGPPSGARSNAMLQAKEKQKVPGWAIMIGLYVLFNYVLK